GAALRVELFLLLARLLLEHVALDVRALLANLDVDRARAALRRRKLEFALRLALERDAARRGIAGFLAAVRLAQMRQQLELRILADRAFGARDLDTCLVELRKQPVDRHLQYLGKLRDRNFCHSLFPSVMPVALDRTNARARP